RSGDGNAHPMIGVDEVGPLADELDRLLVSESPLIAVGNERVGLVSVSIRLTRVLDVELSDAPAAGYARLDGRTAPESGRDDAAAERRSEVTDVVEVTGAGDGCARGGHGLGPTLQRSGSKCSPHAAVELVSSGLGDAAHRAAGRTPVLGHVASGDDVDLV